MSADNGTYILRTRGDNDTPEYRVSQSQAIENIFRYDGTLSSEHAQSYFANANVHVDAESAIEEAASLEDALPTEYGIVVLNHATRPFYDSEPALG